MGLPVGPGQEVPLGGVEEGDLLAELESDRTFEVEKLAIAPGMLPGDAEGVGQNS
jgi:hypothetical protein